MGLNVGVVAIGRNEGERLARCLDSVIGDAALTVYVDSGSTDNSVSMARAKGIEVVELDMHTPFTAARARNEGFRRLHELAPELDAVQFVDGDCELFEAWLETAADHLRADERVAAVCGRLRERHPERSVYNMLCDIEWDRATGDIKECGGIAMMRVSAFRDAQGFRSDLIAGEEPELCVRLRSAGWRIRSLGVDMALHDAAMSRFGQWWKRALRAGYAFAHGAHLHGAPPERYGVRESISAWAWGLGVPAAVAGLAPLLGFHALALLLVYPMQVLRLALRGKRSARENWWYALFLVIGKFPEVLGHLKFHFHRLLGSQARLIEHR